MENESNINTNYNTKDNLSINLRNTQKSVLDKEFENKNIKENNNISLSKKNNIENNKNQIQLKLIKILFGEKLKNKEETKINKDNENNNDNEEKEESEKIFYDSYSDFHRARIPKIKFRNNKDIQGIGIGVDNNKKKKEEIKNEDKNVEKEDEKINENLNINKEKKKIKKIVKKKVKKKKKKIKKDENNEPYETSVEKFDGEETSTQEEKLSHSVQERKVKNKKYFNYKENEEQNDKQKEYKMKKKIEKGKEIIKENENEKENQKVKQKKNESDK